MGFSALENTYGQIKIAITNICDGVININKVTSACEKIWCTMRYYCAQI
jgi:hypothetical protein